MPCANGDAQRAIARQAAQRLVVRADVDAPRRLVAAEQLEGVRLIVGAAALADEVSRLFGLV